MNFLKKAKKALSPEDAFSGTVAIKLAQGGLFAPGERVGGELIWTRDKPCAIRNIVATLNGTLRCPKFREPGGLRILLDSTGRLVYQSPRGSNKPQVLEKGVSEFPFSLPDLPPAAHGLPDSFMWDEEGLCASYWIEFVFWTADKKKHVCRAPFVQMRPVPDLRKLPLQSSKIPSLFKAPNHKISMSVAQMPPIVHPGQQIDFDFRIVNCSTKTATCLSIQLERRTQLHGKKQVKTVASAIFNADHGFNLPRLPKGLDPTSSQDIAPKVERVFTLQIPSNLADLPNTWDFRTILSVKYSLTISLMLGSSRWTVKNPVVLRETDPLSMIASVPVSPPQQAPEPYSHRPAPPPPTGHYPPHQPSRPRSSTSPPGAQADYYAQPFGPPPGGPPPDYSGYYYPPPAASGPYMYPAGEPFPPPPFVQHAYHPGPDYFPPSSSTSPQSPPYTPDFTPSSSSTPVLSQPRTYYPPPLPAQSSLPTMPTHPHTQSEQSPSPLYPVLDYPPAPWSHSPHPYPSDHYTSLPHSWTPPPAEFTIKPSAPPIDA